VSRPGQFPLLGLCCALTLLFGCRPPTLQQGESSFLHTGSLAFLEDGKTTREAVLWRLGTPSAHFEGDRILTYGVWKSSAGDWIRRGRSQASSRKGLHLGFQQPTDDLVLVFDPTGVLVRHSLVVAR
jgi:hypothetical protein